MAVMLGSYAVNFHPVYRVLACTTANECHAPKLWKTPLHTDRMRREKTPAYTTISTDMRSLGGSGSHNSTHCNGARLQENGNLKRENGNQMSEQYLLRPAIPGSCSSGCQPMPLSISWMPRWGPYVRPMWFFDSSNNSNSRCGELGSWGGGEDFQKNGPKLPSFLIQHLPSSPAPSQVSGNGSVCGSDISSFF